MKTLIAVKEVRFKDNDGNISNSVIGHEYIFKKEVAETLIKLGYFEEKNNNKSFEEKKDIDPEKVEDLEKLSKKELVEIANSKDLDVEKKSKKELLEMLDVA